MTLSPSLNIFKKMHSRIGAKRDATLEIPVRHFPLDTEIHTPTIAGDTIYTMNKRILT